MKRLVGLARVELDLREKVFENMVTRALRQTVKTLTLTPLTAAGFRENQLRDARGRWTTDANGATLDAATGVSNRELAIHYYTGAGFRKLNEALNTDGDISRVPSRSVFVKTPKSDFTDVEVSAADAVTHLDRAIADSPVESDTTFYRGTKGPPPGLGVVMRKSYTSTSGKRDKAQAYYVGVGDTLWEIDVPRGSHALEITEGPNTHEEEWVLPRNSRFEVTSVVEENNHFVVRARLLVEPLTAAGEPPAISTTAATTGAQAASLAPLELATIPSTWNAFVASELYPYLVDTYVTAARATAEAVTEATGVTLQTLGENAVAAYLSSAKNRLAGIGDQLWDQLRTQLAEGYAAGESTHQLAARIRETAALTEPRALVIARTEVIPAANAASLEQVQLAFSDADCSKEWLSTTDDRTREAHRKADGQRVPVHQNFTVGGEKLPYPGWPLASADNIISCRCTLGFVFADDASEDDSDDDDLDVSLTAAVAVTTGVDWDPDEHPRDSRDGRFTERVGGVALATRGSFDYLDDDDVLDMHAEMLEDDPWTSEQEEALGEYAGVLYTEMNGLLRGTEEITGPARKEIEQLIDDANAAMRPTTTDLRTARGVESLEAFGFPAHGLYDPLDELLKLKGRKFREPGFFSTSTREEWLDKLIDRSEGIIIEVDVPRGTPAAYLAAPGGPGIRAEGELLLAFGLTYELVDAFQNPGEPLTVRLRVVL